MRCKDCTHYDFPTLHPATGLYKFEDNVLSGNNYCDKAAKGHCNTVDKTKWSAK